MSEKDDERVEPGWEDLPDGVARERRKLLLEHEQRVQALSEHGDA